MKTIVKSARLGTLALAAMLTMAACKSDGAATAPAEETTSASTPAADGSAPGAPDSAASAVLEVSDTLNIDGESLVALDDPDNDPAVGLAAPVITGQQFDGSSITIGGATDGPTMLVFLAHWCPHCNDEIPELLKLRDEGAFPDDLNIIGISTAVADDRDNYPPSTWMVDKGWTWAALADTSLAEAFQTYGGNGFPFTVMLNADGTVNARKSGSESAAQINDWIDAALA